MTPSGGLWERLRTRFDVVAMRPRLADGVRLRSIGDDAELVELATKRVMPLSAEDAQLVRAFDGERSIAELIVAGIGAGTLRIEPVIRLVDRLLRAELLAEYSTDLYRQIAVYLERVSKVDESPRSDQPHPDQSEDVTSWEAATQELADRAAFLRGVSLLASLDNATIGALAEAAHAETWPAAHAILREGARSERFYIIRTGDVAVSRVETDGVKHRVARLGPGEWFGEAGLLDDSLRTATITAGTARPVQLISFDRDVFQAYISPYVTNYRGRELVSRRRARLDEIPLFQALASEDLDRLAQALREERIEAGTIIFRQGEIADAFYVVADGAVGVIKDGAPIARLTSGEFFGETALLFTEGRTATIAATEMTTLWALDRASFTTFIRDALLHRRDMMPTVMGRLDSTEPL